MILPRACSRWRMMRVSSQEHNRQLDAMTVSLDTHSHALAELLAR